MMSRLIAVRIRAMREEMANSHLAGTKKTPNFYGEGKFEVQ